MSASDIPTLERPAFFDGQLLEAADLTAVAEHQRTLRWLHNRTLHGWGVVRGLGVAGRRGDRAVEITAGYALDCSGRELLLPDPETMPVPPVAHGPGGAPASYYLTLAYFEDADLPLAEARPGACGDGGAVRRPERARLRWQSPFDIDPATRYRRGLDVVLATVEVENCRLTGAPATALRRELPGAPKPYIAAGLSPEGKTTWRLYPASGTVRGVEAVVDTSAAGFGATPVYTAHVLGARRVATSGGGSNWVLDGAASVEKAGATSLTLRVLLPRNISVPPYVLNPTALLNAKLPDLVRETLKWRVAWVGVEG